MSVIKKYFLCILIIKGCFLFPGVLHAQNWDINTLKSINPQYPGSSLMKGFDKSTYPLSFAAPVGLLAAGYFSKDKNLQLKGWEMAGSLAINIVVTQGLKYSINRQRPSEKYPGQVFPYEFEQGRSFPSGHTSMAFATATTLTLEFKKWYVAVPAYAWATGVGYSRMYLGAHYPSDVLGGAVVGAGSAVLSHWLTKKLLKQGGSK